MPKCGLDKAYMKAAIDSRIQAAHDRYVALCNNRTVNGRDVTYNSGAHMRSRLRQEIGLLKLLDDLLIYIKVDELALSDESEVAFDRLTEPRTR